MRYLQNNGLPFPGLIKTLSGFWRDWRGFSVNNNWKECKLGEVAEFYYGKMPDKRRVKEQGRYPVFSGYQITGYYDEFNSDEDLIIVARGVGGTGDVKISPRKSYVTNLSIIAKLNCQLVEKHYLYYKYLINNLRYLDSGSAQSQVTIGDLQRVEILLPPLPEQRAIAGVLSSLDNKIDLLHRQNKTLAGIAEALWREMFVEEADPNWERGKLGDYGQIICGKTPSKKVAEYFGGHIPFIKIPDMHGNIFIFETEDSLTGTGEKSQQNKTIPAKSICVSCIATVGLVAMNAADSQTNQQINTIIPNKEFQRYFLFLLMRNMTDDLFARASGGTATDNLNTGDFARIEISIPPENTIQKFDNLVQNYFEKIYANQIQIRTFSRMRDTLLPKLMSGEVRVQLQAI